MFKYLFVIVLFIAALGAEKPSLIVGKTLLTRSLLAQTNLTVVLSVFNVGTSTAYNIEVDDTKWSDKWELQVGLQKIIWDKLAPGENFTHSYVIVPLEPGIYDIGSATVTYRDSSDAEPRVVHSTSYNKLKVWHVTESDRRSKAHLKEWFTFLLFSAGALLVPGGIWFYLTTNFEHGLPKRQQQKRN
eukprot:TRINITY_DN287_c0_g3_i1.p1 TRINITY_DN287_c0_g3~~TRINITY_DN287_c0_g3_i1.p1  ORF type:complete len:204 (-),score=45.97 TRINITY_DN287_c0_g3_i1:67-627(-)